MKCNVTVKAIASAGGWSAEYGNNTRRLVLWAQTDDGIVGLVLGPGANDMRNAEDELVNGQKFTGYVEGAG